MPTKYKYTLENQEIETLDINSIPNGLSYETIEFIIPLEVPISPIDLEVKRIEKRRADGVAMYTKTQATLRLIRMARGVSVEIYNMNVYAPMYVVINQINTGNFIDAYLELFKVLPNENLNETMLLNFKNQVGNYILTAGDYSDYAGKTIDPLTGIIS